MLRSKWSAAFYLVLVFLSGALVGGFSYRLYSATTVTAGVQSRPDPVEWRKHYMDEIHTRVHTTADQEAQLNQIFDDTRAAFNQIRERERQEYLSEQNAQIAKMFELLRPDQRPLFAKLRADREARRKAQQSKK